MENANGMDLQKFGDKKGLPKLNPGRPSYNDVRCSDSNVKRQAMEILRTRLTVP